MKTKWFLRAFAILAGISFAACDNGEEVIPVFPDSVEHTIAAGETKQLTFKANTTWTLSTDKTWCVFVEENGEEVPSKTGQAGTITFTIKVKDTNHDFDAPATANIKLKMTGAADPRTIFEITRPSKERRVTMYKRESGAYHEIPEVELAYHNGDATSFEIGFTANFDWKVLSKTEGIALSADLSGMANQTTADQGFKLAYISLPKGMLSETFDGKIVISDLNGENTFEFAVTYDGMGDEDLFFSEGYLRAEASVNFSNKGFLMSRDASPRPTEEMSFSFTATTKGMESKGFIVALNSENEPEIATTPWLILTDNGDGNYSIAVEGNGVNLGDARNLHVFILPKALASGTPDFSPYFDDGQPKEGYTFKVAQAAAPTGGGFYIGWGENQTAIEDARLIPWNEHPAWSELTPEDMGAYGLAVDNAYIYEFTTADIDGDMVIAPLGITVSGFDKSTPGTPIKATFTGGIFQGVYCVTLSNIEAINDAGTRLQWVTFHTTNPYSPLIGVLLMQKK